MSLKYHQNVRFDVQSFLSPHSTRINYPNTLIHSLRALLWKTSLRNVTGISKFTVDKNFRSLSSRVQRPEKKGFLEKRLKCSGCFSSMHSRPERHARLPMGFEISVIFGSLFHTSRLSSIKMIFSFFWKKIVHQMYHQVNSKESIPQEIHLSLVYLHQLVLTHISSTVMEANL